MADIPQVVLPDDMDAECRRLCEALNRLPGIRTYESCCGHGKDVFSVWFTAASVDALIPVAYFAMACHSGVRGWQVSAGTDCAMSPIHFLLASSGRGEDAYREADAIAVCIESFVEARSSLGLLDGEHWKGAR